MIDSLAKLRRNGAPLVLVVLLSPLSLSLGGCAGAGLAVASAGAGVAMGTGVDYTLNGIAFKTFTAPLEDVRLATRSGFENMGIEITKDEPADKDDTGWRIEGVANNRDIAVDLQRLTPKTTRVRVVADNGIFFKDKATEAEIIYQTADALDHPENRVAAKKATKTPAKTTPVRETARK